MADLDLSPTIVYAINFGDGTPTVGGIVFSQYKAYPAVSVQAVGLEKGVANWWGPSPGTNDPGLNQLLNTFVYTYTSPCQIGIDAGGLVTGESYLLQIIAYEPETHSRNIDITVEDAQIVTGLSPIVAQGGIVGKGGWVIRYEFTAGDPILNIRMLNHENAIGVCGLILTRTSCTGNLCGLRIGNNDRIGQRQGDLADQLGARALDLV